MHVIVANKIYPPIMAGGAGLIVSYLRKPGDPDSRVEAMSRAIEDAETAKPLPQRGAILAEEHSVAHMTDADLDHYQRLLGEVQ